MLQMAHYLFIGALGYAACYQFAAGCLNWPDKRHFHLSALCLMALGFTASKLWTFGPQTLETVLLGNKLGLALAMLGYPLLLWFLADRKQGLPRGLLWALSAPAVPLCALALLLPFGLQYSSVESLVVEQWPWGETQIALAGVIHPLFLPACIWVLVVIVAQAGVVMRNCWRNPGLGSGLLVAIVLACLVTTLLGILSRLGMVAMPQIGVFGFSLVILGTTVFFIQEYRQERRSLAAAQAAALKQVEAVFEGAPYAILVVAQDGRIQRANPLAHTLFRAPPGKLEELSIEALVPARSRAPHHHYRQRYQREPRTRTMAPEQALQGQRLDGSELPLEVSLTPIDWSGQPATLAFAHDVSERIDFIGRLQWIANHDELTALPNRRGLSELLDARARDQDWLVAIFGVDGMDRLNQMFGHDAGDRIIRILAARLIAGCSIQTHCGRLEGGRLLVMLPAGDGGASRAERHVSELVDTLLEPIPLEPGVPVQLSITVGYVIADSQELSAVQILQQAEAALAQAKRNNRSGLRLFDPTQLDHDRRWTRLAMLMYEGLKRNEFRLVYQPRGRVADLQTSGFEVLLRWQSPEGNVPPDEFIRIAEETGFIVKLGRWVLDNALRQYRIWQECGLQAGILSVNVSLRQLLDPELPVWLEATLLAHGLRPEQLELEITETASMSSLELTAARLLALSRLGVGLAMDDFGTGYCSLAYLQKLPFSVIKTDRAFTQNLGTWQGQQLMEGMLGMIRSLNRTAVVEGVEQESELAWLRTRNCDEIQGYLFSKPLEVDAAEAWMRR